MSLLKNRVALLPVAALTMTLFVSAAVAAPPKKPTTPAKPTAAQIAAGKKVYASNNCKGCHAINGDGGTTGPELTTVGADPKHTPKWLEVAIVKPKEHNPSSAMPAFDKIKGKDLTNLVAYLGSLKKAAPKPAGGAQ